MMSRSTALVGLALGVALAACTEQPNAPTRKVVLASAVASDSGPTGRLLYRSDSLSRTGSISWYDGTLSYYVFVHEAQMPGTRTAFFSYGAFNPNAPWLGMLFGGYGTIPASDVTGSGIGDLRVRTNTAGNPDFVFINDSGGPVDVSWKQVPHTSFKNHFEGRFESPPVVFVGNARDMCRGATAVGTFAWRMIPDSVDASLCQSWGHTMVFLMPGF